MWVHCGRQSNPTQPLFPLCHSVTSLGHSKCVSRFVINNKTQMTIKATTVRLCQKKMPLPEGYPLIQNYPNSNSHPNPNPCPKNHSIPHNWPVHLAWCPFASLNACLFVLKQKSKTKSTFFETKVERMEVEDRMGVWLTAALVAMGRVGSQQVVSKRQRACGIGCGPAIGIWPTLMIIWTKIAIKY